MSPSYEDFQRHLQTFGVTRVDSDSPLGEVGRNAHLCDRWVIAMDRALRRWTAPPIWVQTRFRNLTTWSCEEPARRDQQRAAAAELDAALRLRWIGDVPEPNAMGADFEVGDMSFEVYCPQQHRTEREIVKALLVPRGDAPRPCVRTATSHPHTGSGRSVSEDGSVVRDRDNKSLHFPANKLINRLLNAKRAAHQFHEGATTLLWLDLKHGMQMTSSDCLPFRSYFAKGHCFLGTHGAWHAFYGVRGAPLLVERSALDFGGAVSAYEQRPQGWFRETKYAAGAVLSTTAGMLLFENPWAVKPLNSGQRERLMRLSELRPEASWIQLGSLEARVDDTLATIRYLADPGQGGE